MGKKMEQSRTAYNRMARTYDASPEGVYTRPHRAEIVKRAALRDGDRVLDVACGNGDLLGELSKKADIRAFGVDVSEEMIAAARERHPECTFAARPSVPLDFPDGSLDVITVSCAFHHFEAPGAFAGECMRALKQGGRVLLAEPFFPRVVRWLANGVVFPLSKTGDVKVYGPKELRGFFASAGFSGVETHVAGTVLFLSCRK